MVQNQITKERIIEMFKRNKEQIANSKRERKIISFDEFKRKMKELKQNERQIKK